MKSSGKHPRKKVRGLLLQEAPKLAGCRACRASTPKRPSPRGLRQPSQLHNPFRVTGDRLWFGDPNGTTKKYADFFRWGPTKLVKAGGRWTTAPEIRTEREQAMLSEQLVQIESYAHLELRNLQLSTQLSPEFPLRETSGTVQCVALFFLFVRSQLHQQEQVPLALKLKKGGWAFYPWDVVHGIWMLDYV